MSGYVYQPGQRVIAEGRDATVMTCVPGNGTMLWYFVMFNDGMEDRFTADQLTPAP